MRGRSIVIFSLLSFFCGLFLLRSVTSQEKPARPERHEVKVRLVLVDAIVTKDGNFVSDLTKDEFEVYEDGKKLPINSLELVSFGERKALQEEGVAPERPGVPKKQLVLVFDGISSWTRNLQEGARKIVDELVSLARMGNEVMVIQLSERRGLEILQRFTTDEASIRKAMVRAAGTIWVDQSLDAAQLFQEVGLEATDIMEAGLRYAEKVQPILEEEYLYVWRVRFERVMGALLAVVNIIKDIPGRKTILFISDGFPDISGKTLNSKVTEAQASGTVSGARSPQLDIRRETAQVRVFDPFNILQKKKILSAEEVVRELIRLANAHNISLYTLDPEAWIKYLLETTAEYMPPELVKQAIKFRQEDRMSRVQNLRWLAEDTGGASLVGAAKYDQFTRVMKSDLNFYYQLSYYPPRQEPDNAYHKIEVRVLRPGCEVRARKGYTDYSAEEERKLRLVSAFYSPALFQSLPFAGEFAFFHKGGDKFEPWMNIALPTRELFLGRGPGQDTLAFSLHVWIKSQKSGERAFGGQIPLRFKMDPSFREMVESADYLCFHYRGAEMAFPGQDYEAVFALQDEQTDEIGTWTSIVTLPELKKGKEGAVLNFLLGLTLENPGGRRKSFSLSKEDGGLEVEELKFYPAVTNRFGFQEEASAFLQVFLPDGQKQVSPEFSLLRGDKTIQTVQGEIVAQAWDKNRRVWSGLVILNFQSVLPGDYTLKASIPYGPPGNLLSKEVRLTKLHY